MVCSQSCHIYPHTRSHFYTFRFALVTDVESRPPDDDVVGNKIARRTAFIHRAAYLRHIFGVLWRYVSYTFRIRFADGGCALTDAPTEYHLKMGIGTLSTLLLGYKTAERLFELERIEGREDAVERLDDVLFHKIPYISDYI